MKSIFTCRNIKKETKLDLGTMKVKPLTDYYLFKYMKDLHVLC